MEKDDVLVLEEGISLEEMGQQVCCKTGPASLRTDEEK